MNKFFALTGIIGAGLAGFVLSELHSRSSKSVGKPEAAPLAAAGQTSPAPVTQIVRYVQPVMLPAPVAAPAAPAESAAPRAPAGDSDPSAETPSESERQVYADSVFDSDGYDPSWASASSQQLNDALSTVSVPGLKLSRVQCRSTLCKVELHATDKQAATSSVRTLIRAMKWQGSGMAVNGEPDARGEQNLTLYLAKRDATLPEPPLAYR